MRMIFVENVTENFLLNLIGMGAKVVLDGNQSVAIMPSNQHQSNISIEDNLNQDVSNSEPTEDTSESKEDVIDKDLEPVDFEPNEDLINKLDALTQDTINTLNSLSPDIDHADGDQKIIEAIDNIPKGLRFYNYYDACVFFFIMCGGIEKYNRDTFITKIYKYFQKPVKYSAILSLLGKIKQTRISKEVFSIRCDGYYFKTANTFLEKYSVAPEIVSFIKSKLESVEQSQQKEVTVLVF